MYELHEEVASPGPRCSSAGGAECGRPLLSWHHVLSLLSLLRVGGLSQHQGQARVLSAPARLLVPFLLLLLMVVLMGNHYSEIKL